MPGRKCEDQAGWRVGSRDAIASFRSMAHRESRAATGPHMVRGDVRIQICSFGGAENVEVQLRMSDGRRFHSKLALTLCLEPFAIPGPTSIPMLAVRQFRGISFHVAMICHAGALHAYNF